MTHENSIVRSILEYVRAHPGCTRNDITTVMPDVLPKTITNYLVFLRRGGAISKTGSTRDARWYYSEPVNPEFLKVARDMLQDLRMVHPSNRDIFLGKRLQDLYGEK